MPCALHTVYLFLIMNSGDQFTLFNGVCVKLEIIAEHKGSFRETVQLL